MPIACVFISYLLLLYRNYETMASKTSVKSAPAQEGLATRFGAIRGYFIDHVGVKHYGPVFVALDGELAKHTLSIQRWWNSKAVITDADAPVIARMERVVELLKNAKSIAA
jgi:hypothetical protein